MSRYTIGDIEVSIAEPLPKEYDITYWKSRCLAAEKRIKTTTMIDQDYVQSMDGWFNNLRLTIAQIENDLAFHKKEIELHTAHIEVCEKQLIHDKERLIKARLDFDKYLADNKENG